MANNEQIVKRNVKDSVFTDLFKIKGNLVKLYKALHPDDEDISEDDISNVTVENILTNTFYNDLGFQVKDRQIILMEAQSTWSVNIVVRILIYLVQTYSRYIEETKQDVYRVKRINIPKPELYVLYIGERKERPEYLSLSEEFFNGKTISLEANVKVLYGGNEDEKDIITQYVQFTKVYNERVKKYGRTRNAIEETIRICKDKNILAEYIKNREKEVENIMFTLFNQEKAIEMYTRGLMEEVREEAEIKRAIECVENMMEECDMSLEFACKIAKITVEQYHSYKDMLCIK